VVLEGVHIEDLPRGQVYNYVVLKNGKYVLGLVENAAELGVRPFQLARGRGILAMGELRIDPQGRYSFDARSPAASAKGAAADAARDIREPMAAYWKSLFRADGAWLDEPSMVRRKAPSEAEIRAYCAQDGFRINNPKLCR
jgi:hypothetical protein